MYPLIRRLLFTIDPERAHQLTLRTMGLVGRLPAVRRVVHSLYRTAEKPVQVFGLRFPNPVGLAAGYDKDGEGFRGLSALGVGHIEIGTVTPRAQRGNPRPRIFRLPAQQALINRMGFPGKGMGFVLKQVRGKGRDDVVLGVNIGKNKETPNHQAVEEYLKLLQAFGPLVDYIAINVSSPNTVGLRDLQGRDALESLLGILVQERQQIIHREEKNVLPLLVKLAPDLSDRALDDALEAITHAGVDGVIATNTTVERPGLHSPVAQEAGGLSGAPLAEMSTAMVEKIYRRTSGSLPIIGVGGIMSPADAREKLEAGASLIQVYTGLVYQGPGLIKRIIQAC